MAENEEKEEIVRTKVWSAGPHCHGGCGAKVHVKDGKLVEVEGLRGQCCAE